MGYNGWSNRETWAVKLWLDNEEPSCDYWTRRAQEIAEDATAGEYEWETPREMATRELAEALENEIVEGNPLNGASPLYSDRKHYAYDLYSDLLSTALGAVDWRDLARAYLEDVEWPKAEEASPESTEAP